MRACWPPASTCGASGTVRDARKWPKRDRRKDPKKLDHINFKLLSPYTIQKMINGRDLLRKLKATAGQPPSISSITTSRSPDIPWSAGSSSIRSASTSSSATASSSGWRTGGSRTSRSCGPCCKPDTAVGPGKWIDLAGMFAPEEAVKQLLNDIESGAVNSLDELDARFAAMHENYSAYEWAWAVDVLQKELNKAIDQITAGGHRRSDATLEEGGPGPRPAALRGHEEGIRRHGPDRLRPRRRRRDAAQRLRGRPRHVRGRRFRGRDPQAHRRQDRAGQ